MLIRTYSKAKKGPKSSPQLVVHPLHWLEQMQEIQIIVHAYKHTHVLGGICKGETFFVLAMNGRANPDAFQRQRVPKDSVRPLLISRY